jgi:hypothetical protein
MDNRETLATLVTQDTGRRPKQNKQTNKQRQTQKKTQNKNKEHLKDEQILLLLL